MSPRRVDVFSLKGGVGKTTVSVLLARAQFRANKAPVLLVDADLTGTCLGDLLEPWASGWASTRNLAHLICGRPEALPEHLDPPPVYVYRASRPTRVPHDPHHLDGPALPDGMDTGVRFCPSHADSVDGRQLVSRAVLQALMGHESTGGWINHVIDALVVSTERRLGALGGVIVDHGPGMAAVQRAALERVATEECRRALFVTSRDRVDIVATHAFEATLDRERSRCAWLVNKVRNADGWRDALSADWRPTAAWFEQQALPLVASDALALAYADSHALDLAHVAHEQLEALRRRVFE